MNQKILIMLGVILLGLIITSCENEINYDPNSYTNVSENINLTNNTFIFSNYTLNNSYFGIGNLEVKYEFQIIMFDGDVVYVECINSTLHSNETAAWCEK